MYITVVHCIIYITEVHIIAQQYRNAPGVMSSPSSLHSTASFAVNLTRRDHIGSAGPKVSKKYSKRTKKSNRSKKKKYSKVLKLKKVLIKALKKVMNSKKNSTN